ncbi:putative L-type lectin-domain containing receptor kinase S.5 [Morus notabilis]|uniref:non-specific serine/threonine protein kinase n=2 Tax=Morus notabilis TaxID=981085 RepID=W9RZ35_9ROSA|nr:putative L-type lectin-domain containing receptor kinase S.5 [Morus notabilis]
MKELATKTVLSQFFLLLILLSPCLSQKQSSFYFGPFNESYYATLAVLPQASINNGALQVTPDSSGDFSLSNRSGRILLNQSFTLWKTQSHIASFNSSFLVNLYRRNDSPSPGEGLAFLIAPNLSLPSDSHGQYLGLTNAASDGSAGNKIVAVELDTFKEAFDPDGNHLGLDVNSVRSVKTVSLSNLGIEIAPNGTKFYVVWVEYDGGSRRLSVFMAEQEREADDKFVIRPKPEKPVMTADLDLSEVVDQKSYFGFAASTGSSFQLNCVLRWNLTVEVLPGGGEGGGGNDQGVKIGLGIGVPALVILLVASAGLVYYLHRRRRAGEDPAILGALKSLPGTPREFKFSELKKATNNFDDKHNKLGQGGFGIVYRGTLPKEKVEIAVKKFSRGNLKGKDDFLAELTIINRLRHKHLVRLLGWCHKNGTLLLVYDYMPNGSLDNHLFCGPEKAVLSWSLRYKIVSGVASALHYLHNEYDQKVVHRDLKASNIMLDAHFNARLGDFGLARALDNEKTSYAELEGVPGTMGYIAPECFHTGKATRESDVYGFGAVILEVVCGQRPWTKIDNFQLLVDWVWWLHREGCILKAVDERLGNDYSAEEAKRLLLLGLACSHPNVSERPKTQAIVQIISGSVAPPHVPSFKPPFMWPSAVPDGAAIGMDSDSNMNSMTTSITTGSSWNVGWTPRYASQESNTGGDYISEP